MMTSLHDMNMQEALNHSPLGGPSGGIPSPTQAMLMMQKALSGAAAGNAAFPGSIPPVSSGPPLPTKDMIAAAASLGGSNLMTQYYQMMAEKLWGAALANGQGLSPNGPSLLGHGPPPPHVPLPPSLPSSIPASSSTSNLLMPSSSLSSPTSSSSGLASHQPSPLESFHQNANSQGKPVIHSI